MELLGNYIESLSSENSEPDIYNTILGFLQQCKLKGYLDFENSNAAKSFSIRFTTEDFLTGINYRFKLRTTSSVSIYSAEISSALNNLTESQVFSNFSANSYVGTLGNTFLYGSAAENFLDLALINKYNRFVYWSISLNSKGLTSSHSVMNNGAFKNKNSETLYPFSTSTPTPTSAKPLTLYTDSYYLNEYLKCNNIIRYQAANLRGLYKNTGKDPYYNTETWDENFNTWHCFNNSNSNAILLNRINGL